MTKKHPTGMELLTKYRKQLNAEISTLRREYEAQETERNKIKGRLPDAKAARREIASIRKRIRSKITRVNKKLNPVILEIDHQRTLTQ